MNHLIVQDFERYGKVAFNSKLDCNVHAYLYEGAKLVGKEGMPLLKNNKNVDIPNGFISIKKIIKGDYTQEDKKKFIHFFEYDQEFNQFLYDIRSNMSVIQQFAGVVGPDCTMLSGDAPIIKKLQVFYSRAVTFYLQKHGIPVLILARWCDIESLDYALDGIPENSVICVSTYGAIKYKFQRENFRHGLLQLIEKKKPVKIIVYGRFNKLIFQGLPKNLFINIPSDLDIAFNRGEIKIWE